MSRVRAEIRLQSSSRPREASESSQSTEASDLSPQDSASPPTSPLVGSTEEEHIREGRKSSSRSVSRPPGRGRDIRFRHVRVEDPLIREGELPDLDVPGEAPEAPTARFQALDVARDTSEERGGERPPRRVRQSSRTQRTRGHRHRHRSPSEPSESTESMERNPHAEAQYQQYGYPQYDQYPQAQPYEQYPPQQYGYPQHAPGYGAPAPNPNLNMALMPMQQPHQPQQPPYNQQMMAPYQQPYQQPGFFPPQGHQSPPMNMMPYYPWPAISPVQQQLPISPNREPSAAEMELERIRFTEARRQADRLAALEEDRNRVLREAADAETRRQVRDEAERARKDAVRQAVDDYKEKLADEAKLKAEFEKAVKDAEHAVSEANEKKLRETEEEHRKKLAEATAATDAMNMVVMNLSMEIESKKPPPDKEQRVILIDSRQDKKREFRLPYSLAKEWKNFENLLLQAFEKEVSHGISLGSLIDEGKYDLVHSDGTTIMRQYWDQVVEPGWEVKVNLWPVSLPHKKDSYEGHRRRDGALKRTKSKNKKRESKRESLYFMEVPGEAPPPPPVGPGFSSGSPPGPEVLVLDDDDFSVSSGGPGANANTKKKRQAKTPTFWEVVRGKPKKK